MKVNRIYYFSGTHWDREWYQTFQGFRFRLDRVLREMIDYLETSEDFEVFYFDGQTIVFEDFFEVSPEYRERLLKLIRAGKIRIGPWYTMPDEFLVSGEALIRNLLLGHQICRQYGTESWKVGYVCDVFGHIAQLPQILNGFGIRMAVLGRGTGEDTTPMFFQWRALDGTSCVTYKVPDYLGYGSFATEVIGSRARGEELDPDSDEFRLLAEKYIDREIERANTTVVIIMDGADHEGIHPKTAQYIRRLREIYPKIEFVHGNIEECFMEAGKAELPEKKGELIETSAYPALYQHLLSNTLSSHVENKRRNDKCQNLLELWMEPLTVYLNKCGFNISETYLDVAWKHLLKNHSHDAICGCAVDRVHDEMNYQFSQVESIGEALTEESILMKLGKFSSVDEDQHSVINLLHMGARESVHTVTVEIPFSLNYPYYQEPFGYEKIHAFRLFDDTGREVHYRIEKIVNDATMRTVSECTEQVDLYTVTFRTLLHSMGVTTLRIIPCETPVRFAGCTVDSEGNLENEFLKVQIEPDGRITLKDKRRGNEYTNLLGIVSDAEIGDGWFSVRNKCSETSVRTVVRSVHILSNGVTGGSVRILRELEVPARIEQLSHGLYQSQETVKLSIEQTLTLNQGEDFVRIYMRINNIAEDHRLRLHLPTDTESDSYLASQAFAFVKRKAGIDSETLWYKEPDQMEKNTGGILLRTDGKGRGLAVISAYGIHEGAGDDDDRYSLYYTLFRSFFRTHTKNNEKGGQVQGLHEYSFVIKPIAEPSLNELLRLKNEQNEKIFLFASSDEIHFSNSLFAVDGNVVVSCIKPSVDKEKTVVRIFNAEGTEQSAKIHLHPCFTKAFQLNLLEEQEEELNIRDHVIEISVPAGKILTVGVV